MPPTRRRRRWPRAWRRRPSARRFRWRRTDWCCAIQAANAAEPGKPIGSVHGASVGVHASDSANAWRNIARVSNARNTFASLICGAYHTAGQNGGQNKEPYPPAEQLAKIETKDADRLLAAGRGRHQGEEPGRRPRPWCIAYGELGHPARPVFDLLLRYAVSEDGALHAEKYYRTVTEEFAATRPAFRWRQLVALARVTASEYGQPARLRRSAAVAEGVRELTVRALACTNHHLWASRIGGSLLFILSIHSQRGVDAVLAETQVRPDRCSCSSNCLI